VFRDDAIQVEHVRGYAMQEGKPVAKGRANVEELLIKEAVENEEWLSLSPEEREEEKDYRADYIRVDDSEARRILAAGKSILQRQS
jgi:hypothetical protein